MLLQIEKKGNHYLIPNNPPLKHKKLSIRVREEDIIDTSQVPDKPLPTKKSKINIMKLRSKYPELRALDKLTAGLIVGDRDDELLDEYYTERARDEGLI